MDQRVKEIFDALSNQEIGKGMELFRLRANDERPWDQISTSEKLHWILMGVLDDDTQG